MKGLIYHIGFLALTIAGGFYGYDAAIYVVQFAVIIHMLVSGSGVFMALLGALLRSENKDLDQQMTRLGNVNDENTAVGKLLLRMLVPAAILALVITGYVWTAVGYTVGWLAYYLIILIAGGGGGDGGNGSNEDSKPPQPPEKRLEPMGTYRGYSGVRDISKGPPIYTN